MTEFPQSKKLIFLSQKQVFVGVPLAMFNATSFGILSSGRALLEPQAPKFLI